VELIMLEPATPQDERRRLATLRSLKLLDTAPEERFDRITRLARRLFGVPIALVTLVDADRQWFKSKQGMHTCETSRSVSFCGHAILGDDAMIVEDARLDQRFVDNPLVTGETGIRFYAGYPISAPNGSKLGTLCLIDREPRKIAADDRKTLATLGRMVESELVAMDQTTNDSLTGLSNLRGFLEIGRYLLSLSRRLRLDAQILLMKVKGISTMNDALGPAEGDRALVEAAHMLQASFRDSDLIGRIGGDEFAVLLLQSEPSKAPTEFPRLQAHLQGINSQRSPELQLAITVAATVLTPTQKCSLEEAITQTEQKLQRNTN
jgi:diguanylate cyclase (GGDEF)-like protein